ncbi:MAG: type II toxin-antitoxin system Phd/YefM family antitoxin [Deinococcales bacterium]
MTTLTMNEAKTKLISLIEEATLTHQPIMIQGETSNAILLAEADWNNIAETLNLLSIPNMRESIQEGMNTPISECAEDLDW